MNPNPIPTAQEWGALTTQCAHQNHQLRNLKMLVDAQAEDTQEISRELAKLRIQSKTALAVLAGVVTVLVWMVEFLSR